MKNIKNKYYIQLDNFYDENNDGYCIIMELYDEKTKTLNKYINIINKNFSIK